jgi:hypothetical protein
MANENFGTNNLSGNNRKSSQSSQSSVIANAKALTKEERLALSKRMAKQGDGKIHSKGAVEKELITQPLPKFYEHKNEIKNKHQISKPHLQNLKALFPHNNYGEEEKKDSITSDMSPDKPSQTREITIKDKQVAISLGLEQQKQYFGNNQETENNDLNQGGNSNDNDEMLKNQKSGAQSKVQQINPDVQGESIAPAKKIGSLGPQNLTGPNN